MEMKKKDETRIPFTPEHGFDLSLTIDKIAKETGTSSHGIKHNVEKLLEVLPTKEKVAVLEHMAVCKEHRREVDRMKVLDMDKLPASPNYRVITEFLGVTDDELWQACKEYERRMKEGKDPHETFGLNKELIVQTADEVMKRNIEWLMERVDMKNPKALLGRLHKVPRDRPVWTLRLLRQHGFKQVELPVWVAADSFLSKWVENKSVYLVQKMMDKLGFRGFS